MKIKFETNRGKIRDTKALDEALHILEQESKQGFFRSKGESSFGKYNPKSLIEDAKLIELHVVKVYGKGEYKLNGNLSYNQNTKEVKFYILSVIDFDNFQYDEVKMAEFLNEPNTGVAEDIQELTRIIDKIKRTKPMYDSRNSGRPGGNKGRHNNRNGGSGNSLKSKPNPKRESLTDSQKAQKEKSNDKKNFRTDQKRNVANNKRSSC